MKRTKRVLGLALAAVMCMGMLAGCGGTKNATNGTETSEKVLNIATIGETTTLSPLYMIADNRPTQKLLYEGLVKYVDGEIQPVLAEDWKLSDDGTQLTFYLRKGVTFHDGEPFNAEAAIANIESWHINPSFTSLPGVVNYTNIEAVDEYTIRLTYDTPYFAYINDFCWPDVCTMISPKQITQGDFQTVNGYAGTGPYIYDEYVAGQYTTFVRNENYWGEQPYYDKIVAKYIPDNASRVQALKTGEIDLIYGSAELSYEDYNQATAIDGIEGKFAPSGSTVRNIILNFNGNLSDLSVRQALAYSDAVNDDASYAVDWMKDTQLFMSMSNTIWPSVWLVVLPIGAVLYQHGTLSVPVFLTIMILSLGIVGPILGAIKFTDNISQLGTIVGEVGNLLDAPEMVRPDHDADIHNQSIQFQDVSFSYDLNDSKPILDHINLTIQPGTMTALVGPSGSGKSTITKLITGFWEATSGTISLGGVDLKSIPLSQLSSYVSYVSQDNYLFDESIRENIRMGRLSATDQEVEDVARKCGCHDFIMGLEHGYDTIVGGAGGHLSGGERQRIAIARAMLKDAPIIIFDEATAYLDPENESLIQEAISKLVQGKTLIMVAHRLYTVTGADQLVVVNQGRIEATGTHEELLKKCPLYKEMWKAHIGSRDEGGATA